MVVSIGIDFGQRESLGANEPRGSLTENFRWCCCGNLSPLFALCGGTFIYINEGASLSTDLFSSM